MVGKLRKTLPQFWNSVDLVLSVMKRKLNANNVPSAEDSEGTDRQPNFEGLHLDPRLLQALAQAKFTKPTLVQEETISLVERTDRQPNFDGLHLDPRLLRALAQAKFTKPTLVQAETIPLVLEGKDVLVRAKTGSGKTAAYLLPILQSILQRTTNNPSHKSTSCLILVPTRELADQVHNAVISFSSFCAKDIRSANLTQKVSDAVQRSILADPPDVVISTPARAIANINNSAFSLENLVHLVVDEADLVLSYGYEQDVQSLAKAIPRGVQTLLMSATLTSEVDTLKGLFCRNPVVLKLEEKEDEGAGVSQFAVRCAEDEKFLLTYVIFKLQLIKGKCIIFVGDIDRCYRLKLFLEQFGIKSCVLNSELPVNSRIHVVQEFNKGVYDIIIAADDQEVLGLPKKTVKKGSEPSEEMLPSDDNQESGSDGVAEVSAKVDSKNWSDNETKEPPGKPYKKSSKEKDYGVSRGIDFQDVACVLNFDLPTTSKSYTHRIGRTGRAGKTGIALSFVVPSDEFGKHKPTKFSGAKHDEAVLSRIIKRQAKLNMEVKPYNFDMKQVDAFRYRMTDALRAVTRLAVQEARVREIRQELVKSEKLKRHFEENPEDLRHLRHDGELRAARIQAHLKHVPEYLMPTKGKKGLASEDTGFVGFRKTSDNRIRKAREKNRAKRRGGRGGVGGVKRLGAKVGGARKVDPLKTFNAARRT